MATEEELQEKDPPDLFELVEQERVEELGQAIDQGEYDLSRRNHSDRTVLDVAVLLGRIEAVRCLVQRGANVNQSNKRGYTSLHTGAAWGQRDCLEVLIEGGADYAKLTKYNETAQDTATRYKHEDCIELLKSTEARTVLREAITKARDTLTNTEKIAGKWNKEDKSKVASLCNEKNDWLERSIGWRSSRDEILAQVKDFNERFNIYLMKLDPLPSE